MLGRSIARGVRQGVIVERALRMTLFTVGSKVGLAVHQRTGEHGWHSDSQLGG
jgi:hypothetical protein